MKNLHWDAHDKKFLSRHSPYVQCINTGPLNGLICLFDPEKDHSIQVGNLGTGEFTAWIKSTFISNLNVEDKDKYRLRIVKCDLVFDPSTKEHKVICFWNIHDHQVCEVLTVGDHTWRVIDDVLLAYNFREWYLFGASIYVNGSVYYIPRRPTGEDAEPKSILAFDVGKEKFRSIRIPDFILDQILQKFQPLYSLQLLEIDRHPALLSRISDDIVKLWLFDNEYGSGYRTNTWTEVKIELPFYWGHVDYGNDVYSVRFHSVIGTDFIILYLYRCLAVEGGYHFARKVTQYSYNWKKKIFAEIKINGLPSSIPYHSFVSGQDQ
ncbi:uncharacterized protein LOC113291210 [Papaver somniferum]|uniref:uncharacterized protein LOC113291210 n=1 Tax=Papaver somniferum TaxID=3469 RepID=UPI000E704B61|nr:uncharacterized protein LOC113291210 [Papaver somniferum]